MILRCKGTTKKRNMQGKLQFLLVVSKKIVILQRILKILSLRFEDIVIEI